jgi:Na+/H+-translocating membrane pyrophosphatase
VAKYVTGCTTGVSLRSGCCEGFPVALLAVFRSSVLLFFLLSVTVLEEVSTFLAGTFVETAAIGFSLISSFAVATGSEEGDGWMICFSSFNCICAGELTSA